MTAGRRQTCQHPDYWFDREVCPNPCDTMHTRCVECGTALDPCAHDEPAGRRQTASASNSETTPGRSQTCCGNPYCRVGCPEPGCPNRESAPQVGRSQTCVFCERIEREDYSPESRDVVSFEPLNPVTRGHRLFVPALHVEDVMEKPWVSAQVMEVAATYARIRNQACNIITSAGTAATQSVFHLHVHYVPRRNDDGLHLPWTGQQATSDAASESGWMECRSCGSKPIVAGTGLCRPCASANARPTP